MHKLLSLFFILGLIIFSCNNKDKTDEATAIDTVRIFTKYDSNDVATENQKPISNLPFIVDAGQMTFKKNQHSPPLANVDTVIASLNRQFPNVLIEKLRLSNDTLFTVIKDSEYLGERMGTTGSINYVANAIINLTSVPGIRYVKIDMDVHSHTSPGVFTRKDFSEFKEIR